MLVLVDREQLRDLGERLAASFAEHQTEIIGGTALVVGALVGLMFYALRRGSSARSAAKRAGRRQFQSAVAGAQLTDIERKVLDKLTRLARAERTSPGRVVRHVAAFDRYRDQLLAAEGTGRRKRSTLGDKRAPALETTLSAVRVKLGLQRSAAGSTGGTAALSATATGNMRSTTDLPPGAVVVVVGVGAAGGVGAGAGALRKARAVGKVVAVRPNALALQLQGSPTLVAGEKLQMAIPLPTGLYRVSTVVLRASGPQLLVAHRERLDRVQRRQWARGRGTGEAWLVTEAGHGPARLVSVREIGGGGGTLATSGHAPEALPAPGERCAVRYPLPDRRRVVQVAAIVVRASRRGLHLQFENLTDAGRDRLVGLAHAGQRAAPPASLSPPPQSRPAARHSSQAESAPIVATRSQQW